MSSRILYSPSAVQDLGDILDYISQDNPEAAARVASEIREGIGLLAEYPIMGRRLKDRGFDEHRVLVFGNYLAFYVVAGEEVQIRRILHGARRFEPLLEDPQP